MTKKLKILRGISGSGKSTYTRKNFPDAVVCSADDYFKLGTGSYVFNVAELGDAHLYCWSKCHDALVAGTELVVVDNTNTQLWEMSPYVQMGKGLGYEVEIIRMDTPPHVAAARNVHGVPADKVRAMADRFQKVLPHWKETVVSGVS